MVVAGSEHHLGAPDLVQHLVQLLLVDVLGDEGGGGVEADSGPEVSVAGEPGRHVAAPAGAHCPEHCGAEGPGVGEQQVTHLSLARPVPVRLGRQPGAEVGGRHTLHMGSVEVTRCHHLPATRP